MAACGHCRRTSAKSYDKIIIYLRSALTKSGVYLSVYVHPSNIDPVSKDLRWYLIKEGVISSFDASSVGLSTHVYFHNRLYVVSRQLATLDDPDPDLDHGRKIWFLAVLKLNGTDLRIKSFLMQGMEVTVPGSPAVCWIKAAVFWSSVENFGPAEQKMVNPPYQWHLHLHQPHLLKRKKHTFFRLH